MDRTLALGMLLALETLGACKGKEAVPAPTKAPAALVHETSPLPAERPASDPYQQHIAAIREALPAHFKYEIEPPFVVIGNASQEELRARAQGTVRWAVEHLKRDFFDADPAQILEIYLFEDAKSYAHYSAKLFEDAPDTPYGFYSPSDGALVMNISTGGGTLVHEIVHPFVESNFPSAPAWFNEGLGSLFEQSASREGHIVGLTNWRLRGLKTLIESGELPSLKRLTKTTRSEFYDDASGDNYAQARYLLYYLQEEGLLLDYYRAFKANSDADPSGYKTLLTILEIEEDEVPAFEARWKSWVLGLRFPG